MPIQSSPHWTGNPGNLDASLTYSTWFLLSVQNKGIAWHVYSVIRLESPAAKELLESVLDGQEVTLRWPIPRRIC